MRRSETVPNGPAGGGLTARQEAVAALLAGGMTLAEASRRGKVGTTTLKRWAKETAFAGRVLALRSELTARALGRLADASTSAADCLANLCRKGKSESVRLAAARAVLELNFRLGTAAELAAELASLEAQIPQTRNRR